MNSLKRFSVLSLVVLALNLIWEFSHYSLYIDLSGIPQYIHLVIASLTDMTILLGIFIIVSLKNKSFKWIKNPSKLDYLFVAFVALVVAIIIEIINLNLGRWEYKDLMPTIFGIGISPLIQLALTGIISLFIMRYIER